MYYKLDKKVTKRCNTTVTREGNKDVYCFGLTDFKIMKIINRYHNGKEEMNLVLIMHEKGRDLWWACGDHMYENSKSPLKPSWWDDSIKLSAPNCDEFEDSLRKLKKLAIIYHGEK